MAGLDPAIITEPFRNDPRVKPGGDGKVELRQLRYFLRASG